MHHPWRPAHDRSPVVEAPIGVGVFVEEIVLMPHRWAERHYNLQQGTAMKSGGHFAPMEESQALVERMRRSYRKLRN